MIVKDADTVIAQSREAKAGVKAEQNIAFYLRRAFGDHRSDVLVFNDIRLQHENETVQIDHLVVHQFGLFVIESKSVSGEIKITPDGQYIRHARGCRPKGMESPVHQARRQVDMLRRILQAHKVALRDRKLLGIVQGGFQHCPMEVRVAISPGGIIRGAKNAPEVCKADLIVDEIEARIASHRRGASLLNLDTKGEDGLYRLTDGEMERLRFFLLAQHRPRACAEREVVANPSAEARSLSTDAALPAHVCSKCGSADLRILSGRYGYYFKCAACRGNTSIDTRIDTSGRKGMIRKSGPMFYLVCPDTARERLFYTNCDEG